MKILEHHYYILDSNMVSWMLKLGWSLKIVKLMILGIKPILNKISGAEDTWSQVDMEMTHRQASKGGSFFKTKGRGQEIEGPSKSEGQFFKLYQT